MKQISCEIESRFSKLETILKANHEELRYRIDTIESTFKEQNKHLIKNDSQVKKYF